MGDDGGCGDETSDQQLHKAQAVRRGAEHVAKQLLVRLDRCYTVVSDNTAASHTTTNTNDGQHTVATPDGYVDSDDGDGSGVGV